MEYPPALALENSDLRSRSSTWPLPDPALEKEKETVTVKRETPDPDSPVHGVAKSEPKKMRNAWGNLSYAELITQAILSSAEKRLTLSEIYEWIVTNVAYFHDKATSPSTAGWKASAQRCICCVCMSMCTGMCVCERVRCVRARIRARFAITNYANFLWAFKLQFCCCLPCLCLFVLCTIS